MQQTDANERLSLESQSSDILATTSGFVPEQLTLRSRLDHMEIYVGELERELLRHKELLEREQSLRKEVERQNRVLQIRLDRLTQKRVRFNESSEGEGKQKHQNNSFKEELKNFSTMIDNRIQRMTTEISKEKDEERVNLIQNFAVFGVPESVIMENTKELVDGMIVTSMHKPTEIDQQTAKMVYPSGAMIKRILGDKIFQKATEIITKSYSRENSFLISFENQQASKPIKSNPQAQKLLNTLNPQRRLFCLCIGTYDFTYCGAISSPDSVSTSMMVCEKQTLDSSICASEIIRPLTHSSPEEIAVSQRVYCITSYFPFFSFYEEILLLLLNMLKVQRLEIFQDQIEGLAQADSRYHSLRVKELFQLKLHKVMARTIMPDMVYQVRLLNETITLNTKLDYLLYSCIEDCLYQIFSVFTIDTFLEVLSLCLLEDKLVFVCQNSHILTYTVYLFVNVLVRPLIYAFASVYILPSEEFLSVPFPVVYGLLKKKKWIQQNRILEKFKNTYVFITPLGIYVQYTQTKKDKYPLDKLKSLLLPLFKQLDKGRRLTSNKQSSCRVEINEYIQHSTQDERQRCIKIIETVKKYIEDEVIQWIPSKQKIGSLKEQALKMQIPRLKDMHTHVIEHIIKYIKDTKKSTDAFFNRILHTQMLSIYFQTFL